MSMRCVGAVREGGGGGVSNHLDGLKRDEIGGLHPPRGVDHLLTALPNRSALLREKQKSPEISWAFKWAARDSNSGPAD
jgi:hypothetical protein